jgi:hypothetical protein
MSGRVGRLSALVAAVLVGPVTGQDVPASPTTRKTDPAVKLDKDSFIFRQVTDGWPPQADKNPEEYRAYHEVLRHARRFPQAELDAAARRDVTFRDLLVGTRTAFRFDLVYFEGRLKRLRDIGPSKELADAGVTALYEGWVFPGTGEDPLCVLTTELPPGLDPQLEYDPSRNVAVGGYYFKVLWYNSNEKDPKKKTRRAPLLMARSLTLLPSPATTDGDGGVSILARTLGLVGVVAAAVLGLTWYFRRGDRTHRTVMAARREQTNPFGDRFADRLGGSANLGVEDDS